MIIKKAELKDLQEILDLQYLAYQSEVEYPGLRYELFTSNRSVRNIALYQRLGYNIFSRKKITEEMDFVYLEKC